MALGKSRIGLGSMYPNRFVFGLFLLMGVVVLGAKMEGSIPDPDVIVLTNDNFDSIVNKEELIAVEFYAPWCGHCKHLQPEWAKAATDLKPFNIPLAKVDATENSELAGRFKVNGYPTIKLFRAGKDFEYKGPREQAGIVKYMKKQVGPSNTDLNTVEEVLKFTSNPEDNYAVVGFFFSQTSSLQSSFAINANALRDNYRFGKVVNKPDVAAHFGIEKDSIVAFKQYDEGKVVYTGSTKTKAVEEFVRDNSFPVVGNYTSELRDKYSERGMPIMKLFNKFDFEANGKYFMNRVRPAAEANKHRLSTLFVHVTDALENEMKELGVDKTKLPVLTIEFLDKSGSSPKFLKYHFEETLKAASVTKFVDDYFAGKLTRFIKSEKPQPDDGFVKVVTGRNFDQIVNDPDKDVLIEFYAPWCGHCQQLAPKYKQLAEDVSKYKTLVIAKIDATANDYPAEFSVRGYPSVFLVPAKANAKPIAHDGEKDAEKLLEFIKTNAVHPLKLKKKGKKEKKEL